MKGSILLIICIILLSSHPFLADETHRPDYPFSDEVFEELPPFPEDFYEINSLFLNRDITAWHLGEDYLQPELIDTWDYWSTEVYGKNKSRFGIYGASFYPSAYSFANVKEGDVIDLSGFIKADWGIQYLQGCSIYIPDVEGLDIELVHPEKEILLQPTYPKFIEGWIQKILIEITVLEENNYSFKVYEGVPSNYTNSFWKGLYGDDYISLGSLVRLSMTINLYMPEKNQFAQENKSLSTFIGFAIVVIILLALIVYLFRKYDAKRERNK